jgi:hypothetical protein
LTARTENCSGSDSKQSKRRLHHAHFILTQKAASLLSPQTTTHPDMSGRQGGNRGKVLLPPINFIFRLLQQQIPCSIWLYEQLNTRIEGKIRVCALLRSPTGANNARASTSL